MLNKLLLPKLGQTMEIATIDKWHKQPGEAVVKGEVILEITTDKATLEVESYHKGVMLACFAEQGMTLPVNSVLALIGKADDEIPADMVRQIELEIQQGLVLAGKIESGEIESVEEAAQVAPAAAPMTTVKQAEHLPETSTVETASVAVATAPEAVSSRANVLTERPTHVLASPRARKLAADRRIRLEMIAPSGPEGRIVEADVQQLIDQLTPDRISPLAINEAYEKRLDLVTLLESICDRKITAEDLSGAPVLSEDGSVKGVAAVPSAPKPLTAMRRIVAQRLSQSKQEIPHFYLKAQADMTKLVELRGRLNRATGIKHSYNDFIMKALGMNLQTYPSMATLWTDKGIVKHGQLNVGLAVALEDGLIVPVIRDVDKGDVSEIATQAAKLVEKARGKKLLPEECEGACMTVSNLGAFHVEWVLPIINPGEASILGVGAIEPRVVVIDGNIGVRQMCTITLALDHRLVDGAVGASFLRHLCELLEEPSHLLPEDMTSRN